MRREHAIIGGGAPLPPFAENLVFWAPLTEGDLTDHISGETGTTSAGASVQWDGNLGMYLLSVSTTDPYGRGHDCCALKYNGSQFRNNFRGVYDNCTMFFVLRENTYVAGNGGTDRFCTSRYVSFSALKEVWETSPRANVMVDGNRLHSGNPIDPSQTIKAVVVLENGFAKYYKNGAQTQSVSWDSLADPLSLAIMDKNGHATATSSGYNTISASAYIKDVRVYNRVLTVEEILQL